MDVSCVAGDRCMRHARHDDDQRQRAKYAREDQHPADFRGHGWLTMFAPLNDWIPVAWKGEGGNKHRTLPTNSVKSSLSHCRSTAAAVKGADCILAIPLIVTIRGIVEVLEATNSAEQENGIPASK